MVTATSTARRSTGDGWLDAVAAAEEAERRRHERLVLEDRVQRLNRQLLGPRKDPETGEWSKKHRGGTCGLPHSGRVEMGYVSVPDGLGAGQLRGVVVCGAMDAWTALRQSRLFRKRTPGGGGFCRQVEVTWSLANGFHPHLHRLVEAQPTRRQRVGTVTGQRDGTLPLAGMGGADGQGGSERLGGARDHPDPGR